MVAVLFDKDTCENEYLQNKNSLTSLNYIVGECYRHELNLESSYDLFSGWATSPSRII